MIVFRLLEKEEIPGIVPLLHVLDPELNEETIRQRLTAMCQMDYRCVGIFDNDQLIGASGLWILTKYYVGRHIEPDNVILLPEHRGRNIGQQLMQWIYDYARAEGCEAVELNCYVTNETGQQFWESEGFIPLGIHYQKKFDH